VQSHRYLRPAKERVAQACERDRGFFLLQKIAKTMPPADTLDGELLKALLDESSLPRAVRGAAANLVKQLEETLSGARPSLFMQPRSVGVLCTRASPDDVTYFFAFLGKNNFCHLLPSNTQRRHNATRTVFEELFLFPVMNP
jgi:hypothetical protein